MKKRHINEFLGTTFEGHGNRAAGMGILHDRYDNVMVKFPSRSKEEKEALNGPVITKKIEDIKEEE